MVSASFEPTLPLPEEYWRSIQEEAIAMRNYEPYHGPEEFSKEDFALLFDLICELKSAHKNGNICIVKEFACKKTADILSRAYLQLKNWE
jgi:hypothetical protein